MNYDLSIIVPIYKVEKYIKKCFFSIYEQIKEQNVELILVNDGTPDRSVEMIQPFIKNTNIRLISQENKGLSSARNRGIEEALGRYIWFVDSDDWIEPNAIKNILSAIKSKKDADSFLIKIRNYNEKGEFLGEHLYPSLDNKTPVNGVQLFWRKGFSSSPIQEYIVKSNIYKNNQLRFKPGIYHEDMEFAPCLLFLLEKIYSIPQPVYAYLIRDSGSIITTPNFKRIEDLLSISYHYYCQQKEEINLQKKKIMRFTIGSTLVYAINQAFDWNYNNEFKQALNKYPYKQMAINSITGTPSFKRKIKLFLILFNMINYHNVSNVFNNPFSFFCRYQERHL